MPAIRVPVTYQSQAYIFDYSGGFWDEDRQELGVWGGGHGDYPGNEVCVFSLLTEAWRCGPQSPYLWAASNPGPAETQDALPDGTPAARHTYSSLARVNLPGWDGFFVHGGSLWQGGYPVNGTWFYHRDTGRWERLPPRPLWGESDYSATSLATRAVYDPVSRTVLVVAKNVNAAFDFTTKTWEWKGQGGGGDQEQGIAFDPERRILVILGSPRTTANNTQVWDTSTTPWTRKPGPAAAAPPGVRDWGPGLIFDPVGKRYIAYYGGRNLWALDRDTWQWGQLQATGADPGPAYNVGTFGRFQYVRSLNGLVVINSIDSNVFYFQLGGAPAPIPAPDPGPAPLPGPTTGGDLTIPPRTWLSYPLPPQTGASEPGNITPSTGIAHHDKHVSGAAHPSDRRTYFAGGDYYGTSYRSEVWALDEVKVVALGTTVGAWELVWPYCGFPPAPSWPSGPDFVSWYLRGPEFYLIPGEIQPHNLGSWGDGCGTIPGGYDPATDTPMRFGIYAFDPTLPIAQRARLVGRNAGNHYENWRAPYDPVTDTFWRTGGARNGGDCVAVYDPTADVWEEWFDTSRADWYFDNHLHQTSKSGKALDVAGRALYCVDPRDNIFFRVHLDSRTLEHLGPLPGGGLKDTAGQPYTGVIGDKMYLAFDEINRIVLFCNYIFGVYAYHPDHEDDLYNVPGFPGWEDLSTLPGLGPLAGSPIHINCISFNPYRNVFVGLGPFGHLYLFRYAEGLIPVPSPGPIMITVPGPPVTVTTDPALTSALMTPPAESGVVVPAPISETVGPPDNTAAHAADDPPAPASSGALAAVVGLGWVAVKLLAARR
jgi:hypothetical protein